MKYCSNCNTYFKEDTKTCVICGRTLVDKEYETDIILQGYPDVLVLKSKVNLFIRIFFIIAISSSIIAGMVNLATLDNYPYPWSLIILGTFIFIGNIISFIIFSSHNYTTKTVRQVFIVSLLLIVIDYFTEYKGWALTYVIPFIMVSTTLVLPIITAARPKKYYLHVRSLLLLVIMNFIILLIGFFTPLMIKGITWTALMTGSAGIVLFITMLLTAPKTTYHEIVKIFHI